MPRSPGKKFRHLEKISSVSPKKKREEGNENFLLAGPMDITKNFHRLAQKKIREEGNEIHYLLKEP